MNSSEKPQILLTNDDSINSPGLWAAAEALAPLGYVHVVAPRVQQTSMGRALPRESDGLVNPQTMIVHGKPWEVFAVGGSPAQSVLHGLLEVMQHKPDLVVSGINYGENIASGLMVSGTIGAAVEAATMGVPALAVSLQTPMEYHFNLSRDVDFSVAGHFAALFAAKMLNSQLPFDVDVLKVDIPQSATVETPWVLTRQSRQRYFFPVPREGDDGHGSRNMGYITRVDEESAEPESDLRTVVLEQKVSVTPLSFDMTSRVDFIALRDLLSGN